MTGVAIDWVTDYHSFFYTLLSVRRPLEKLHCFTDPHSQWEHPRATAITFAATIFFIFACRYLPILPWILKVTYLTLGGKSFLSTYAQPEKKERGLTFGFIVTALA